MPPWAFPVNAAGLGDVEKCCPPTAYKLIKTIAGRIQATLANSCQSKH